MAGGFDPYYTWLGIAPEEQPPNHYRLLGIRLFEDNLEVISNAADRQMAHLRTFQTGAHAPESQRLLNEVAAARVCLLKAEKKADYDANLRASLPAPTTPQPEPALDAQLANVLAEELAPHPQAHPGTRHADKGYPHSHGPKKPAPLGVWVLMGLVGAAAIVLLAVLLPNAVKAKKTRLLLDWAEAERQEATLTIDEETYEVAASGEVAFALDPGEHHVQIRWPTYAPFDCAVLLKPGEDQTLPVNRRPMPGMVVLDWPAGERAGGALSVDGKPQFVPSSGEFRLKLEPGEHVLRLTRTECKPIEERVEITPGAEIPLAVRWTKGASSPGKPKAGPGLTAKLFAKGNLAAPFLERKDADIHCVWDNGTPDAKLPAGEYSIHWTGWLKAPLPGRYKFVVRTDGQAKVWLDDRLLIADAGNPQAEVELDTAPHALRLEYDGGLDRGYVVLNWVPPVDKSPEQTVPAESLFLHRASADQTAVASTVLTPAPVEPPPSADPSQPVDLLRRVDVAGHVFKGHWWFHNKSLVCEFGRQDPPSVLKLPLATLPTEYEVRATVERLSGDDNVTLGLVCEGRRFDVVLDGWPPRCISGVELLDGLSVVKRGHKARAFGRFIPQGKKVQLRYTVRKERLTVARDGEIVFDWPADYSRCSPRASWGVTDSSTLILRVFWGVMRFSQLELLPLSNQPTKPMASGTAAEQPKTPPAPPLPRQPVPSEEKREEATAALKTELGGRSSDKQPFARLAWAAHLIQEARQREGKPAEQYVLLTRAADVALKEGDCWLPLAAAEDLSKRFEVSGASMKIKALTEAARHARTTAALETLADLASSLAKEALAAEAEDGLLEVMEQLRQQAQKRRALALAQAIQKRSARLEQAAAICRTAREALAASKNAAESPTAALKVGRYAALIEEDWDKALPLLAKSEDSRLAKPAAQLVADRNDGAAQLAMGDAWSEVAATLKQKSSELSDLAFNAARHWYELILPRLADKDLARVREQLCRDLSTDGETTPRRAATPFKVLLHGLGGASSMGPTKTSGGVRPEGGFATFQGQGAIEYALVPSSAYIHELQLTFLAPQGTLQFLYGDPEQGGKVHLGWNERRGRLAYDLRTYRRHGGIGGEEKAFNPKEPLHFTVYVNENQHSVYEGGTRVLVNTNSRPADLQLRIVAADRTQAVISQCEFRPWNRGDAQRLKVPMPVSRLTEVRPLEAALRFHVGNLDLADRPNSREGKAFVVPTTGTPMQWVAAGSFQRENRFARPPGQRTEVILSRGFWIGRYEVTQGEWMALMGTNPSRITGSPFLPVDGVSWHEAMQFCQDLTRQEAKARRVPAGFVYRLPTEAEWEYACRAGSQSDYGVEEDGFWCAENSGWRPHEVGEGKPNAWGLLDMHGNADEWAFDTWSMPVRPTPLRLTDPVHLPDGKEEFYQLRGGAWWQTRLRCRSGDDDMNQSAPGGHRGFRIVLARAIGKSE